MLARLVELSLSRLMDTRNNKSRGNDHNEKKQSGYSMRNSAAISSKLTSCQWKVKSKWKSEGSTTRGSAVELEGLLTLRIIKDLGFLLFVRQFHLSICQSWENLRVVCNYSMINDRKSSQREEKDQHREASAFRKLFTWKLPGILWIIESCLPIELCLDVPRKR